MSEDAPPANREAMQISHLNRLLDRVRAMSGFGYEDQWLTVSIAEIEGALAEGGAEWDAEQIGVIPE